ncbi:HNH endonuclease [Anaerocolumna sedimenticola]|nr:HNH endonuclease [Anaerocolumna sedimenticola]
MNNMVYIFKKEAVIISDERNGIKWTREETILAFDLYCKTPFGKISRNNKDIIELANLLGRTPSSVGLKMHNLAHFDPELRKRNVTAMAHGSKLDEEIWQEFSQNWLELTYQAQLILAKRKNIEVQKGLNINDYEIIPEGEYKEQLIKIRIGQYFFRTSVLNSYNNRCCVTGLSKPELLIASHIKPWKDSDSKTEKTNPSNGLCLNAFHDKAFDKGFITINKDYCIIISNYINKTGMDEQTRNWLISYNHKQIYLPDKFLPGKEFIQYHNDMIFKG